MRASYGQDRGEGGDGKYACILLICAVYKQNISTGTRRKKAVPRCDAASRWGELRGCAPIDIGQKYRLNYLSISPEDPCIPSPQDRKGCGGCVSVVCVGTRQSDACRPPPGR